MPAKDTPLVAARRARLREWIDTQFDGSQTAFIARTKLNQGMLSALLKPDGKSFGEKAAANLESIAGMPAGYLVKSLDPVPDPSQDGGLDYAMLESAMIALHETVEAADVEMTFKQATPLIAFAYQERVALGAASKEEMRAFDRRIRKELRARVNHGDWSGRVAGEGEEGTPGGKAEKAKDRRR